MSDLRQLAEAASPGAREVRWTEDGEPYVIFFGAKDNWGAFRDSTELTAEDAAFIAACDRDTVLALLDERDRLKEACEEMLRTLTCPSRQLADITREDLKPWLPMLRQACGQ